VQVAVLLATLGGCGGATPRASSVLAAGATSASSSCAAVEPYWPTAGWRATCPASAHVDAAALRAALDEAPRALKNVRSVLVIRHGWVVGERYYGGASATTLFEMRSVTKSFVAALFGAALRERLIDSTGETLFDALPGDFLTFDDTRKRAITLRHLLSMRAGWSPDSATPALEPRAAALIARRLARSPGEQWQYDDGTYHTLSAVVDHAVGGKLFEYATTRLFQPLGMAIPATRWPADEQGVPFGSGGMTLTAREMAKLGFLYLHDGEWDGRRILAAGWVDSSWAARSTVGGGDSPLNYGYGWWGFREGGHDFHFALGWGGQFIAVAPDLDLIVVVTANPYEEVPAPVQRFRALLRERVLPALLPE
jgi:CubicO group peptidase (beta-lactamase class C family)